MTVAALTEAGLLRRDVALGPMTTYRIGGDAAWFAEPAEAAELIQVLVAARELSVPVIVLGRGSNVVVASSGVDALVVRLSGDFASIEVGEDGVIGAGGAAPLARVARTSVDADRGGLEFLVGVPGSVGGAVRMNAGCLGSETADWMLDATIVDRDGTRRSAVPEDLAMGYRSTSLTDDDIVVAARFRTEPQPADEGRRRIREVTQWRRLNQPGGTLNAGSVFKNPAGDAAGRIIDSLGLKDTTLGGVRVSPRHANFFEAHGDATPEDVYRLMSAVRRQVAEETGIVLEPEIRFLGDFEAEHAS
jgi:UDP-N-acetylmuramate dehydrogenase